MTSRVYALLTALALAIIASCAKIDQKPVSDVTGASFALSTTGEGPGEGVCISSGLVLTGGGETYVIPGDIACTQTALNVPLPAGSYELTAPDITCVPPNDGNQANYVDCTFDGTAPAAINVETGEVLPVAINVTLRYLNGNVPHVLGAGEVDISLGDPNTELVCPSATDPRVCVAPQECLVVEGQGPECWTSCTVREGLPLIQGTCPETDQVCMPVVLDPDSPINPNIPNLVYPGTVLPTGTVLYHVCVPGAAGTGGTSGTGGAPPTGGSPATGGSLTGGTSGTGGTAGTGGISGTGGVEPGASCTVAGSTITCTLDNCEVAAIACVADDSGSFWGACTCLDGGTGGTSGSGGTAGTGGVVTTGGTSATGGTATGGTFPVSCAPGQQVVRFDATGIVVGLTDTAFPGSDAIRFGGMQVGAVEWTNSLCTDLDPDDFSFVCVADMAPGTWNYQVYMPMAGAGKPGENMIYWGDLNYSGASCPAQWGGDGSTLGTLTIAPCTDQDNPYTITMVPNGISWADPNPATTCEVGEMLTYNGQSVMQ